MRAHCAANNGVNFKSKCFPYEPVAAGASGPVVRVRDSEAGGPGSSTIT